MSPENIETSFEGLLDESKNDSKIEKLKSLLKTVTDNRQALGADRRTFMLNSYVDRVIKALVAQDNAKVNSIATEAAKAGIGIVELKAACKKKNDAQKNKGVK